MLFPAAFYGPLPDVNRRIRGMVKRLVRGQSFDEALGADRLIDTASHPGLFLMEGPDDSWGKGSYYVLLQPLGLVWEAVVDELLPAEMEQIVFERCLETAWGLLLLLPHEQASFFDEPHRWSPFLAAAARFWPTLAAEGARYSATWYPLPLDHVPNSIHYVLANMKVPFPKPGQTLPPDWSEQLLAHSELARHFVH